MKNVIHLNANYDHEIPDFLKLVKAGHVDCGILVYRTSGGSVNVLSISEEEMEADAVKELLNAGIAEVNGDLDVFTID